MFLVSYVARNKATFVFLFSINVTRILCALISSSIFCVVFLSVQLIMAIRLHSHISTSSNRFLTLFNNSQLSHPYITVPQTNSLVTVVSVRKLANHCNSPLNFSSTPVVVSYYSIIIIQNSRTCLFTRNSKKKIESTESVQ